MSIDYIDSLLCSNITGLVYAIHMYSVLLKKSIYIDKIKRYILTQLYNHGIIYIVRS